MDGPSSQTRAPSTDGQAPPPGSPRPAHPPADVNGPRPPQSPEAPRRPDPAQGQGTSPQTGHRSDAQPAETNGPGPKPADAPPHAPEPGKPTDTTAPRTDQQAESWRNDFEPAPQKSPEPADSTSGADSSDWQKDFEPTPSQPSSPSNGQHGDLDTETDAPSPSDATKPAPKWWESDGGSPFDPKPDPASGHDADADTSSGADSDQQSGDVGEKPAEEQKSPWDQPDESPDGDGVPDDLPDQDYLGNPNYRADEATHEAMLAKYDETWLTDDKYMLDHQIKRRIEALKETDPELYAAIEKIPHDQKLAMHGYTKHSFSEMNKALRTQDPEMLRRYDEQIRCIVSGMNQLPDFSGKAHRVVTVDDPGLAAAIADSYEPGKVVTEHSFTSTSVRPDPDNPDQPKSKFSGLVEFHMEITGGKDLRPFNDRSAEAEILLPPGTSLEVTGKYQDPDTGKWHIHVRQVPTPRLPDGSVPPPLPRPDWTPPPSDPFSSNITDALSPFG